MRVMPDTNVIVSAILFPSSIPSRVLEEISLNYTKISLL